MGTKSAEGAVANGGCSAVIAPAPSWQPSAGTGAGGTLAKAIAPRPDVIVTETRLAGINGYQAECPLLPGATCVQRIPGNRVRNSFDPPVDEKADPGFPRSAAIGFLSSQLEGLEDWSHLIFQ